MQQQAGISFAMTALRHNAMLKVFENPVEGAPGEDTRTSACSMRCDAANFASSNFISLLADDKASRHRKRRRAKEPCDRNCVVISPVGLTGEKPMAARGDGWAAVWKNCSSFATVFRSSVPSTVFHAPLCFAKRPRRRLAGPPTAAPDCSRSLFIPFAPLDAKASLRYTTNFSLLSLFRRRTRQRRPSRSPEKASCSFLLERTLSGGYGKK